MIKIYTDGSCIGNPGKGGTGKTTLIKIKDPREYYQKLVIHNNLRTYKDYLN